MKEREIEMKEENKEKKWETQTLLPKTYRIHFIILWAKA